jgi:uncharacterized protein (DUF1778 family)
MRDETIEVRVTSDEKAAFVKAADAERLSLSAVGAVDFVVGHQARE